MIGMLFFLILNVIVDHIGIRNEDIEACTHLACISLAVVCLYLGSIRSELAFLSKFYRDNLKKESDAKI